MPSSSAAAAVLLFSIATAAAVVQQPTRLHHQFAGSAPPPPPPKGCHGGSCGGMAHYPVGPGIVFDAVFDVPGKPAKQDGM